MAAAEGGSGGWGLLRRMRAETPDLHSATRARGTSTPCFDLALPALPDTVLDLILSCLTWKDRVALERVSCSWLVAANPSRALGGPAQSVDVGSWGGAVDNSVLAKILRGRAAHLRALRLAPENTLNSSLLACLARHCPRLAALEAEQASTKARRGVRDCSALGALSLTSMRLHLRDSCTLTHLSCPRELRTLHLTVAPRAVSTGSALLCQGLQTPSLQALTVCAPAGAVDLEPSSLSRRGTRVACVGLSSLHWQEQGAAPSLSLRWAAAVVTWWPALTALRLPGAAMCDAVMTQVLPSLPGLRELNLAFVRDMSPPRPGAGTAAPSSLLQTYVQVLSGGRAVPSPAPGASEVRVTQATLSAAATHCPHLETLDISGLPHVQSVAPCLAMKRLAKLTAVQCPALDMSQLRVVRPGLALRL